MPRPGASLMATVFPTAADGLALHRRLCGGDPLAPNDFANAYLEPLTAALCRRFPGTDGDLVEEAVIQALIDVIKRPDRYEPARSGLRGYLLTVARRDLLNALRAEEKHQNRRVALEHVEVAASDGNEMTGADAPDRLANHLALTRVRAALSEPDRRVLDLMCQGERRWEAFAAALGLADRPRAEWERTVKRVTDRITRRLKRAVRTP